jgi:hypothetical protein
VLRATTREQHEDDDEKRSLHMEGRASCPPAAAILADANAAG